MLDLAALPIAFALTLWDAVPVYLPVGIAVAVMLSVLTPVTTFQRFWNIRGTVGLEGVIFVILLYPSLVAVIVGAGILGTLIKLKSAAPLEPAPATPGSVIRQRGEEMLMSVLLASALAAVVKVGSTAIAVPAPAEVAAGILVGALCGFRSGAVAIPAVAVAVHLGGLLPAALCVGVSVITAPEFRRALKERRHAATGAETTPE